MTNLDIWKLGFVRLPKLFKEEVRWIEISILLAEEIRERDIYIYMSRH